MPAINPVPESGNTLIPDQEIYPSSTVPQSSTIMGFPDPIEALELLTIVAKPETLGVSNALLPFPTNELPAPPTDTSPDEVGWNMPLPVTPKTTNPSRCIPAKEFAVGIESSAPNFGIVKTAISDGAIKSQMSLVSAQTPIATATNNRGFAQTIDFQIPETLPEWPAGVIFETRN
ncbi:hypothetical protein LPJ73_001604, partial [Coemansia sp. RSA 2703]